MYTVSSFTVQLVCWFYCFKMTIKEGRRSKKPEILNLKQATKYIRGEIQKKVIPKF